MTEDELIITDKVNKDIARYKSRHPEMSDDEEQMLRKEMTRIQTDLLNDKKKSNKNRHQKKKIENIEKNSSNLAKKRQKTGKISSNFSIQQRHTGESKNVIQNTLKQDISRQDYYKQNNWKLLSNKKRKQNIECNNGLCELCNQKQATEVHHLVKFYNQDSDDLREQLLLDEDNLICLCSECHHNIHNNKICNVQLQKIIDDKRDYINRKYFNMGKLLNMSDICFLNY